MTIKVNQSGSTACEYRGPGMACGTCYGTGGTRCSFELEAKEVDLLVTQLFKPWNSFSLSCS